MGEDKSLLPFGNFPTLTQFQYHRLKKLFKNVYISCKNSDKFDFEAEFIEDVETKEYAPTAGFIAIFEKLDCKKFFVLSVDAPFVDKSVITKLLSCDKKDSDATIARTPFGMQPMCGIYHKSLEKDFKKMLENDNHKLGYLLKNSKTEFITFNDDKVFLNLNYPAEYQEALNTITL